MRFSVLQFMLLIALLSLPLAGFYNRYNGKKKIANYFESLNGCTVTWDHRMDGQRERFKTSDSEFSAPKWIQKTIGSDARSFIQRMEIKLETPEQIETGNQMLGMSRSLRGLDRLKIWIDESNGELDFHALADLDDVRLLEISGTKISSGEFECLANIEDLEVLWIRDCEFEVEHAASLRKSKHLAWIEVGDSHSNQKTINRLRELLPNVYISF